MTYSAPARRNLLATSADEPFLVLVEITHADLAVPVRVVNDNQNVTVQGAEFIACPFEITLPDDVDQQVPQARLSVDNIGRELTQWLEFSNGGKGARCRILQVMRSANEEYALDYFAGDYVRASFDDIEYDMTMDLTGLSIDNQQVSGTLGFQNTLLQAAVAVRFDPFTAPGLF